MNVVYISIDACNASLLRDSETLGLTLPNLRRLAAAGTWASKGAKPVFPSFTYPCHASMITGVYPETHGVVNNTYFDPEGKLMGAWYWYAKEKGIATLWDLAHEAGYVTANIGWSTSIGAALDYDLPQVWFTSTPFDVKFMNAMSRPQGFALELEQELGRLTTYNWDVDGDWDRNNAAIWLMKNQLAPSLTGKEFFLTMYYAGYDDIAHNHGTLSKEARFALEEIDRMVGELVKEAEQLTNGDVAFCIVSDHGMLDNHFSIRPNALFAKEGLISYDDSKKVTSWEVYMQRAGGTAEIRLRNPQNQQVREQVSAILQGLAADPESGIAAVLTPRECKQRHGLPDADFGLVAYKGYEFREDLQGEYLTKKLHNIAQHGYNEDFEEMQTIFLLSGKTIASGIDIESLALVDFAPTVAKLLQINIPFCEGKSVIS